MLTINLSGASLLSGGTNLIDIVDLNCNIYRGRFSLTENQIIPIQICQVGAGVGKIKFRNVTRNGQWNDLSMLFDGDEVTPYESPYSL
jgi:hypothetical protein